MSLLVVNADDAGFASSTDDAILACARCGVVRSASVAANGATAATFVERARAAGLDVGLHVNLTEGPALAGPHATLTDAAGSFRWAKDELWQYAAQGLLDPDEVAREVAAQWAWMEERGAGPSHIDGHNHVHLLPAVRAVLAGRAESLWVRTAQDRVPPPRIFPGEFARWAAETGPGRRTDHFTGYAFSEAPEREVFLASLEGTDGVTEFMVHPGRRPGGPFPDSAQREREAAILCDAELMVGLERRGIRVVSFAEI